MPETRTPTNRRLNRRAAATLAIAALTLGGVALALFWTGPARISDVAAEEIQGLAEAGRTDLALRHLGQYLAANPDDVPMLLLQGRLMAEQTVFADNIGGVERAVRLNQRLLRLDDPRVTEDDRDAIRQRLAEMLILLSDAYRANYSLLGDPEQGAFEQRYQAAANIARRLIEHRGDDPEAHLLLGRALEGLAGPGQTQELNEAITSYRRALNLHEEALAADPDDPAAVAGASAVAARLASLLRDRADEPEQAEAALDRLVAMRPKAIEPRLVRYRYAREAGDEDLANGEIQAVLTMAPDDPTVRLAAAEHALHHGDPEAAREHLQALTNGDGDVDNLQILLLSGLIEFAESDDRGAMEQWREGLILVRGAHAELTWWLAYVQLRRGHLDEAEPLIEQYRRIAGGEDAGVPALELLLALRDEHRGYPLRAIRRLEDLRGPSGLTGTLSDEVILALGRCYEAVGEHEQAARVYRLAARADPRAVTPVLAQARLSQADGDYEQAARFLEQTLGDRETADPTLLLALAEIRLAQQAALPPARRSWEAFDAALAALPEAVEPINRALLQASREELDGRPDRADALLERTIAEHPSDPRLWSARAEAMTRAGRPTEALDLLRDGLRVDPPGDNVPMRLMAARVLVALGRGREARLQLVGGGDELKADQHADLQEALGRLLMTQGDPSGAIEAFRAWAKLEPSSPEPILAQLEATLAADRVDQVAGLIERLGQLADDNAADLPSRIARASTLLYLAGRADYPTAPTLKKADELISGVLSEARELPGAHLLLGRIRRRRGHLDEAASAFRRAWDGGLQEALPPLVDVLAELGRFDDLERLAGPGSDAVPGQLSAQALLGAGQVERAGRLLDRAVADPSDPAAANLWRGRMLELSGRRDELESLLRRRAESAATDEPGPWLDLVAAQVRDGRDRDDLEVTINRALNRTPGVPSGSFEARLRLASGDPAGADAALEAALAARADDPALLIDAASFYQQTDRADRAEPLLERLIALGTAGDAPSLQLAMLLSGRAAGDPEAWQRALKLVGPESDDPEHRLARAVILARCPDPARRAEAIAPLEALIADLPIMHPRAVEARDQLARLLIELGQPARAAQVTAVSADQVGASSSAVALHARALLRADRLADADRQLDRLDLLRPADPEAATLRAELLLSEADGLAALERAAADRLGSPGGPTFARAACLQLLNDGSTEAVTTASRIASDLAARRAGLAWVAALTLAAEGRADAALDRCVEALPSVKATDLEGLTEAILQAVQAAPVDARSAAVSRARPMLAELLSRRPGDPDLMIAAAVLDHQTGDYAAEADGYRRVLDRRPGDPMALYNLALVLSEGLGRPEEALEVIDRLADRAGPNAAILGARGVILTRLGRFDEAIHDLSRAVELAPTADRHYYLARAHHKAGHDDQFRRHLDQARASGLDPDTIDAWQRDELQRLIDL